MALPRLRLLAAVLALALAQVTGARHHLHNHDHFHRLLKTRNPVAEEHSAASLSTRGSGSGIICPFPSDADIVAVAANMKNAGWAIAPDIQCVAGMYCPYACPPGQVMAQWQEGSTYTYPASMVS